MIGEAVSAFRGDVAEGQTELRLELPVDAHIPEDYVDSERLRLEAYQKLSAASGPAAAGRRRSTPCSTSSSTATARRPSR